MGKKLFPALLAALFLPAPSTASPASPAAPAPETLSFGLFGTRLIFGGDYRAVADLLLREAQLGASR